jgi:competence protein ComEA
MKLSRLVSVFVLASSLSFPGAGVLAQTPASDRPATVASPVNLNTASVTELQQLRGVGPSMAARIVEYREKNGGFKKVEELMNIQGIGEKRFLELKSMIVVTPPRAAQ